ESKLGERLAVSESLLYRRGNFNGTFDELILDALLKSFDAQVAFSPGFRWGVTILPGQEITLEEVYGHTALTYPNTWVRELAGRGTPPASERADFSTPSSALASAESGRWRG